MPILRQVILAAIVIAITGFVWIRYVPSATATLDRIGVLDALGIEPPAPAAAEGGPRGGRGPVSVVTAEVSEARINDRVTAIGDGRARRSVTLRTDADGQITSVEVTSGSYVEEGQTILTLDDRAERFALERAVIVEEDAREEARRVERLRSTGSVTVVQTREAELALRSAELAVSQARYELDRRTLRAPFSGWLGILDAEAGDRIDSGDAVATLTDRAEILIDFRVPERVVGSLALGQSVSVRPLAAEGFSLEGEITAIDAVVERTSRTLRVQAAVDNAADRLRAGMAFSVEMSFEGDALPGVPPLAVQWSSDGPFVWTVRDGTAARVPIRIRQRDADVVLVEGDLAPGDTVITEGVQNVRPGAEVRASDAASDARADSATDRQRL